MSDTKGLNKTEIIKAPGKLMMFLRLAQFINEGHAKIHEKYKNVIMLDSFISNTFSIGKEDDTNNPFLGIQDKFVPWFVEPEWSIGYLCPDQQYLYLVSKEGLSDGIVIGIKIRKKRMSILWNNDNNPVKYLFIKIFKIESKFNYKVSNKIFSTLKMEKCNSIEDVLEKNNVISEKEDINDEDDEIFKNEDLWR